MLLIWGVTDAADFYELDEIARWLEQDPNLDCVLAATTWPEGLDLPPRVATVTGFVADAIEAAEPDVSGFDVYVAGPRAAIVTSAEALQRRGVAAGRVLVDSFGLQDTAEVA
jgi:NAD(P)H-flavin reductase